MFSEEPTIANLIAAARGSSIAIADQQGLGLTYRDLRSEIGKTQQLLALTGINPRDTVAFVLRNSPETAALFMALVSYCRVAPINPGYKVGEIEFTLRDTNAVALIATTDARDAQAAAEKCGVGLIRFRSAPHSRYELEPAMSRPAPGQAQARPGPDDVALLLHTSGTTGRPKLAGLTQRNLWLSSHAVAQALQLTPVDRCLSVMPFFHIHGLVAGLLASLCVGATVCCAPGFQAMNFFSALSSSQATWYTAVPAMHQAILARATHPDVLANHKLRFIRSSSAPLYPAVWKQLESVFGVPVLNAYGMTEAAHQIASVRLSGRSRSRGTVGFSSGPQIAVMGRDDALLPPGLAGEVVLRGEQIITGYLSPLIANESAFSNGWFRTGDEGFLNAEGELTLTGRLKEVINVAGEKVAPAEIDEALMAHPAVRQAVAFSVPCPLRGERVGAAVVLRAEVGERELQTFLRTRLARFKVPHRILIVDEIPNGATGKVQRIGMAARLGIG